MPPRVLIAEDDNGVRLLLGTILRRSGAHVEFAGDGREAIDLLRMNDYDAILLDLMMPTASGFEVLAWLHREKRGLAQRKVIVLTALSERDLTHLTEDRVFAVVRKPFELDDLMSRISSCIEGPAV